MRADCLTEKELPWLNHWPQDVPLHINYPNMPIQELLTTSAKDFPQNIAIVYEKDLISYAQLEALANQFANTLLSLGVKKGKCVALFMSNMPQFTISFFGTLKTGASVTAINPLNREREVEYQLNDSGAETIVTTDSLYPILKNLRESLLKNIFLTGSNNFTSQETVASSVPRLFSLNELLENKPSSPPNININPLKDTAALQYTGGTTGTPKAAILTHHNLLSNALAFAAWIRGTPAKETFLTALPLYHIYGMTTSMNVPISLAAKIVIAPKFEPQKILKTIETHKVTVFCGVPTMYSVLVNNSELGKYDLTSIRVCISGASPLPPQIQKRFMEVTGGFLAEGYGLTEASPVTHCNPVDITFQTVRVGSIGLPLPDTNARIVDLETGQKILQQGEIGELAVKGPQVMTGYWKKPKETGLVLKDGWLLTGDIAYMDSEGYFYITDRKKDLIKYKDYSVYPREIEDVFYEHPEVKLSAVIGKSVPGVGEIPKAFVVLKEGSVVTENEIMKFVNDKLAPYKAVREIEFRNELPLSGAGKVLKRNLK